MVACVEATAITGGAAITGRATAGTGGAAAVTGGYGGVSWDLQRRDTSEARAPT